MSTVTHTTQKNEKKEVTGYEIRVDGVLTGNATKTDKGKFNYAPVTGAGTALADQKTMRDLKVEVAKGVDATFLANGVAALKAAKPAKEPKAPKAATTKAPGAPTAPNESDVELD